MVVTKSIGRLIVVLLGVSILGACSSAPTVSSGSPSASAAASSSVGVVASSSAPAGSTTAATGEQIAVVATTSIIADLVANVGGERVAVSMLLPPGTDPHTYAPTPSDVQAVATAQILFVNGLGLEEWLEELTANAGGERTTIVVSDGLTPIVGGEHADEDATEHADEDATEHADEHADEAATGAAEEDHEHAEGGNDPHMWLDVQNAIGYVQNIRDGLQQADPDGAATYTTNAAAYIQQLETLDAEIRELVATVPAERRKLTTNHDTFGYFAKRYGFEVLGTVFEGVSTEQEPSARQIAELVERIRDENVPAVFTENTVNARLAQQIADEAGVNVVTTLYTDALGEPGSEADTYLKMMRYDVEQIVNALK